MIELELQGPFMPIKKLAFHINDEFKVADACWILYLTFQYHGTGVRNAFLICLKPSLCIAIGCAYIIYACMHGFES